MPLSKIVSSPKTEAKPGLFLRYLHMATGVALNTSAIKNGFAAASMVWIIPLMMVIHGNGSQKKVLILAAKQRMVRLFSWLVGMEKLECLLCRANDLITPQSLFQSLILIIGCGYIVFTMPAYLAIKEIIQSRGNNTNVKCLCHSF